MQDIFYIAVIAVLGIAVFLLWQRSKKPREQENGSQQLILIQGQIQELRQTVDEKLGDSTKMFQQQYSESAKLIANITEKLTRLDETNKQVVSFADQLQNLQDILKNPKQRGILGEYFLETLLKNVFGPGQYQMQYPFRDGTIVDAVVFVRDKIIPIDSKFSIENYNRLIEEKNPTEKERLEKLFKSDLKARIDETAKYVKPNENTMDFAIMFIPHEAIYSDLLEARIGTLKVNAQDLVTYASQKHVTIVSPTTFLALLQTILQGLNAMKIGEDIKQITKNIGDLTRHLKAYEQYHNKLGNALSTSVNAFNASNKEFKKIDKDVTRIAGSSIDVEVLQLEKPSTVEEK